MTNIVGRADYISDIERQEKIVTLSPPVDFKEYQRHERANQKTDVKNNEGRELVIALPNEWADLAPEDLSAKAHRLAALAIGKETDMQWAVHNNKKGNNLHMHVVFSERSRLVGNPENVYTRDVYHTKDGKVARNKAERAVDKDGRWLPPVHKKGEMKTGFTAKNKEYRRKGWLHETKEVLQTELQRMGAVISLPNPIHQIHEGKGEHSAKIREVNAVIKELNSKLLEAKIDRVDIEPLRNKAVLELTQRKFPAIFKRAEKWICEVFDKAREAIGIMRGEISPSKPILAPVSPSKPPQPVPDLAPPLKSILGDSEPPVAAPAPPQPSKRQLAIEQLSEKAAEYAAACDSVEKAARLRKTFVFTKKQVDLDLKYKNRVEAGTKKIKSCLALFEKFGVIMYHNSQKMDSSPMHKEVMLKRVSLKINELKEIEVSRSREQGRPSIMDALRKAQERQRDEIQRERPPQKKDRGAR